MKTKIFLLFLILSIFSCKNTENQDQKKWQKISSRVQISESKDFFELKSGKYQYKIPVKKLPFKKIVLLNASLVGYITELKQEKSIVGVASPEYIYSTNILDLINKKSIITVGDESKYELEKIISLQPDAVFTNYIENFQNTYDLLKKNGIEVIFIDEYLEQKPLEKTKIIEVFGRLLGCENQAKAAYNSIEKNYKYYASLSSKSTSQPIVIANEMYGNQWYMPGGKTFVAELLKDAGAQYILGNNQEDRAVPLTFEEVYKQAENAKFWVNIGNYPNKNSLLSINPNYNKLNVFNHGQLYAITGKQRDRANDYFESGVVRADWVLKDYLIIFHPEILPNDKLMYMKLLQ